MRAFRVAYDGSPFYGFQRQPDVPTVEDTLFDSLCALGVADNVPEGYAAAGRTDAGVSALAQTVAFECPEWLSPSAFNSELPGEIRVWASTDVDPAFHATHDAYYREYVYHSHAPRANLGLAKEASRRLSGEHDFHNLTPDTEGTVRDLDIDVLQDDDYLVFTLRSSGFARNLVRRVVSLIHAVATGEEEMAKIDRVLASEPLDGKEGVPCAPAHPLYLADVGYDFEFAVDGAATKSLHDVFGDLRVERRTRSRVARDICRTIE
ncbi:tRNA pseudouridine(38,39,40) synthase TruA [Haladaptatus sp. R4]|uniref:tRNA pseudouridine(38-40) synthase TruA n=1 Tax=Haladaptatus sp. R4 TaxID=1679489 RepID=UPI0007B46E98|nr:tRNA pseudouridine(38-40) synthase TruA [Haladaptatus sp. R4]KZN25922.1 tRNA pseudouridine(38,39,40) synthase TruA [Haladaptatus sp. R4]